jgi:DNA-binding MarR family transcriptional regulator
MSRPLDFDPIIEASRQWSAHGWEDASGGMAAITSIVRAQQLFLARIDAVLRPLELTFARYEVLMLLLFSRRGALPLNKIGARLQVHPTSVTNAVDRLEEQGLIKRVPHSSDRRTTLAEILPVGRELALRATTALNDEVFSQPGMADEDLELLVGVLQRFRQKAGDFGAPITPARAGAAPRLQSTSEDTFGGATARGTGAGGANRATSS